MKRPFLKGLVTGALLPVVLGAVLLLAGAALRSTLSTSANALGGGAQYERARAVDSFAAAPSAASLDERDLRKSSKLAPPPAAPSAQREVASEAQDAAKGAKREGPALELESPARTRAWFPETFLFAPVVVTDAEGKATVPVQVPDRLTDWRVLALAHSREGAQAGAVTAFRGTLPAYVDPVVPAFLRVGDEVRLPVQVFNTTAQELVQPLKLQAAGAKLAFAATAVRVPAGGQRVEEAVLKAERPGVAQLQATLGTRDVVVRTIPVLPTGRPLEARRGGTLAAPRSFELAGPADLEPDTAKARLVVYPGALAVLRSEVAAALGRGGLAEEAYALQLAGRAPKLFEAMGDRADPEALRTLALLAGQRAMRRGRNPDPLAAAQLAEAAVAHPENPVLRRLAERLGESLATAQRPDGTFAGEDGWTLQRLLVATADCVRALRATGELSPRLKQRAEGATVRANGAFERSIARVEDAYTAAAIVASGAVSGTLAERLRERVRKAVVADAEGNRSVPVEEGVVRPDGARPHPLEATALAALALEGDAQAPWRSDLAATLIGQYRAGAGWGDGRTDAAALQAVLSAFRQPLPARISIELLMDDVPLVAGALESGRTKELLVLEAPVAKAAGPHRWTVRAQPAVPGLGFSFSLQGHGPWKSEPAAGLELAVSAPREVRRGQPATIVLEAKAPEGIPLRVRYGLAAGFQPEREGLERLVSDGAITGYRVEDGAVEFSLGALEGAQVVRLEYRAIPTLAGTFRSGVSSIAPAARPEQAVYVPPAAWTVR